MQVLYQASDEIGAQLLCDWLRASHICATILNRYQSVYAGELLALQFPVVWILEDEDLWWVRPLPGEFLLRCAGANSGTPWRCACGTEVEVGFDQCWHCSRSRSS